MVHVTELDTGGYTRRSILNAYDKVHRLVSEEASEPGTGRITTTSYTYDRAHNRTTRSRMSNIEGLTATSYSYGLPVYSYGNSNQLLYTNSYSAATSVYCDTNYTYDVHGNRTGESSWSYSGSSGGTTMTSHSYTWDSRNRLTGAIHIKDHTPPAFSSPGYRTIQTDQYT